MTTAEENAPPRRRIGRARGVAIGAGFVLIVVLTGLWVERRPIAAHVVDRYLVRRGVAARYRIVDLGTGRQRLADVVIGDPAAPDLVADWLETSTRIGLDGASVTGLRAGGLKVRARWLGGKLSLGSLDRLWPTSTNAVARLPSIDLDVADARVRVETPAGTIDVILAGRGRLDGGFRGKLAAVSGRLATADCVAERPSAVLTVRVDAGRPTMAGPLRVANAKCGGVDVSDAQVRVLATGDAGLTRWTGGTTLMLAHVGGAGARVRAVTGRIDFAGSMRDLAGSIDVRSVEFSAGSLAGAGAALAGRYGWRGGTLALADGARVSATGVRWTGTSPGPRLSGWAHAAAGTPVAPLLVRLASAVDAASRSVALSAILHGDIGAGGSTLRLRTAQARSSSGANVSWAGLATQTGAARGTLTLAGGGFPAGEVRLARTATGTEGVATLLPYVAPGARLALDPTRFRIAPNGTASIATRAMLSGPLGNGRIDGATLPIVARLDQAGRLIINPGCTPLTVDRLKTGTLMLAAVQVRLCPTGVALLTTDRGGVVGHVRIDPVRLTGLLGSSPIAIAAGGASFDIGARSITIDRLAVQLGAADRPTSLDVAALNGRLAGPAIAGVFQGASGRIGAVPLLLSDAAGTWSFAGGELSLAGAMIVADADSANPRFNPLPARAVTLRLADGRIAATGMLVAPGASGRTVATVTVAHDLASGAGRADLTVPALVFDKALQPDALTPAARGVVADVAGTVTGAGHIGWSEDGGVVSTGTFRTSGLDLAAAFGPVTGIAGEIRFVDLLGLKSAPDQRLTVREVNPGIPIDDGVVRFELPGGSAIRVADAQWPFAGGQLTLAPTILDFSTPAEHALTFRVTGVDARRFLAQFDFKNLDATGTFDGVLPILFDATGGRIQGGDLTVREGGGSIAYVGELSAKDLGFWGNVAFQALKSLRYRRLSIAMNGPLAGEMVTQVRFAGISEGKGAKTNSLIRRIERLPFVFDVQIKAPFRGLIDSAQGFYDPRRLIERNLPMLLGPNAIVQPPASAPVPQEKRP